jgi:putative membrane protein
LSTPELKLGDTLAIDRTRMAAERTLMAWVRTALSMISFGFGSIARNAGPFG